MTAAPVAGAPGPVPTLEVTGLHKRFGDFVALDDVSLRLRPGSFHALLGENGAGKSTLVKCVMGYHRADGGSIRLGGEAITPGNPREAQALGIGMVYQHFTVVPNMTVAENLVLSRARLPFRIDWKKERRDLAAFIAGTPFSLDLDAPVRSLAAGQRQKLEILKQLYLSSRIVILDEPTSVLTPQEADEALGMLHTLSRSGKVSVLLITHKFREVLRFCDEVTVLRRGRPAGQGAVADLTAPMMAEMMMGSHVASSVTRPSDEGRSAPGEPRLDVIDLGAHDDRGGTALHGVKLQVRAGEVVGIAAVAGNGQEELVEVLAGQRQSTAGRIRIHGADYQPTRRAIDQQKVRCLPEEPLRNACVADMTVADNMAFGTFDRQPMARARWFLSGGAILDAARGLIQSFGVRTPSPRTPIGKLSGGNVQRAVLARELSSPVRVLVVANPCMGLDFKAVAEVHDRIRRCRDAGAAVLLVSADLDEILALADRVLVMSEGHVVFETPIAAANVAELGQHMAGHGARHAAA